MPGFREISHWFYRWKGQNVYKEAVYFLVEALSGKVKISHEHLEFLWTDYETAMKTLTYKNTKDILKAANDFLKKSDKSIKKFLDAK